MKKSLIVFLFCVSLLLVSCGGSETPPEDVSTSVIPPASVSGMDYLTIDNIQYPLYPGAKLVQKLATFHMYKFDGNAEEVFQWYTEKMMQGTWTVALDGSNGKTGQRTFQKGDPKDRPSLIFVVISVFQDGDNVVLNITPQPNGYRD